MEISVFQAEMEKKHELNKKIDYFPGYMHEEEAWNVGRMDYKSWYNSRL